MRRTIIPFGPQHPVLPEPIHLSLTLEGETVVQAVPALGYVHRGLEGLCAKRDFKQMIQVVERVCGICSMIHSLIYCQCIEELMDVQAPPRARFLRVIWGELHRMHSHLLWLGLFADSFGFENLFMRYWKVREAVLDVNEATTGNRIIVSVNVIGGTRRDLDEGQCRMILDALADMESELKTLESAMLEDATVERRTRGVAVLPRDKALELGAAGPVLRASGVASDMRVQGYAAYKDLDFAPVTETDGDCRARAAVRCREIFQSIALVRQAISRLPRGEIAARAKGNPEGETVARVEQPRGECLYYVRADGSKYLTRVRIRTPTFANIPALVTMLPGLSLADVPVAVLSIDPCISCTER